MPELIVLHLKTSLGIFISTCFVLLRPSSSTNLRHFALRKPLARDSITFSKEGNPESTWIYSFRQTKIKNRNKRLPVFASL